jgi:hypothetical protein
MSGEGLSAEEREAIALALRPFIKPGIRKVEATDDVSRAVQRIVARRESEAAEKALAPIERLLASFGHVRDEDHGDDDDWPCVRCEMDRAIAQGRADSVAQGREEAL